MVSSSDSTDFSPRLWWVLIVLKYNIRIFSDCLSTAQQKWKSLCIIITVFSSNPKYSLANSFAISYEGNYLSLKQHNGSANIQVEIRPNVLVYHLPSCLVSSHAVFSLSALDCLHIADLGKEFFWVLSVAAVGCCYCAQYWQTASLGLSSVSGLFWRW